MRSHLSIELIRSGGAIEIDALKKRIEELEVERDFYYCLCRSIRIRRREKISDGLSGKIITFGDNAAANLNRLNTGNSTQYERFVEELYRLYKIALNNKSKSNDELWQVFDTLISMQFPCMIFAADSTENRLNTDLRRCIQNIEDLQVEIAEIIERCETRNEGGYHEFSKLRPYQESFRGRALQITHMSNY